MNTTLEAYDVGGRSGQIRIGEPVQAQHAQGFHLSAVLLGVRNFQQAPEFSGFVEAYFSNKIDRRAARDAFETMYAKEHICILRALEKILTSNNSSDDLTLREQNREHEVRDVSPSDEPAHLSYDTSLQPPAPEGINKHSKLITHSQFQNQQILLSNTTQRKHLETFLKLRLHAFRKYNIRRTADAVLDLVFLGLSSHLEQFIGELVTTVKCHAGKPAEARNVSSPRLKIRDLNTLLENRQSRRWAEERKALILAGETFKRGRTLQEEDDQLKEKVSKVLQEEEDRARAVAANEAARSAIGGEAKYLRWSTKAGADTKQKFAESSSLAVLVRPSEDQQTMAQKMLKRSVSLTDMFITITRESLLRSSAAKRKQQYLTQLKLRETSDP